jgi:hypothetical protein
MDFDTLANEEFDMDYNQLGFNEKQWVIDEYFNRLTN